jgi:hypothetical protein
MRVKGYSESEAADLTLHQQVRWVIQIIKGEVPLCPKAVVMSLLLVLTTVVTVARPALQTIVLNPMTAPIIVAGGINAGILPSPERKGAENGTPRANLQTE